MDYSKLAQAYEFLESTSGRLEKTRRIAKLLRETPRELLVAVVALLEGRVFPVWSSKEIGIANLLMVRIIAGATGYSQDAVSKRYDEVGDMGSVAQELLEKKRQQALFAKRIDLERIFEKLQGLADVEGKGSQERKFSIASELITSCSPKQAKYIVRTILGTLRTGVSTGVVRDSVMAAFFSEVVWEQSKVVQILEGGGRFICENGMVEQLVAKGKVAQGVRKKCEIVEKDVSKILPEDLWNKGYDAVLTLEQENGSRLRENITELVEWAWYLRPDYGEIALQAASKGPIGLRKIGVEVGKPIKLLLAEKSPSLEAALMEFEKPVLEIKYDGARVMVHKDGSKVWLYTRRMEDVTKQFPDVAGMVKELSAKTLMAEGEMVAVSSAGKMLPFQLLSQRVKRKYDIEKMAKQIPVGMFMFDIVYLDGRELFDAEFSERRRILEGVVKGSKLGLSAQLETKELKEAEKFYGEALAAGQEGLIVKNKQAKYLPGRRVGYWYKVKPSLETLDLVVVGAVWGTGKRAGTLSSLILGCQGTDDGEFLECGMMGTGIKEKKNEAGDVTFEDITEILKPLITGREKEKVIVRPQLVVEVEYEEIQKSPTYSSGYALRFPRFVRIREDKGPADADGLERLERIYGQQKGGR